MGHIGKPRCEALDRRRGGGAARCKKREVPGEKLCRVHLKLQREGREMVRR